MGAGPDGVSCVGLACCRIAVALAVALPALALVFADGALAAEGGPSRRAVPDDGRMTMTDHGYRDWGPELVHYDVDTRRFRPGRLVLLGPEGDAVPFQIDGDTLSFVARVPKGGSAVYTLGASRRDRSGENSTLTMRKRRGEIEIANEFLSVRAPAPSARTYRLAADAGSVPPPILTWAPAGLRRAEAASAAQAGGEWIGAARFATPRRIASHEIRIVREGPACVEYEARYRFAPVKGKDAEYVWRLGLSPGMPVAVITEEFDASEVTEGEDLLMLDLHAGRRPEFVGWGGGAGEEQMPKLAGARFADYIEAKRKAARESPPVGGVGDAPSPFVPEKGLALLEKIVPAGKWGGYKGSVCVWDGDAAAPAAGAIGLVPLHAGSWRRTMALNAWHREGVGVTVGLPISVRQMRWSLDIADDFSPFSTHEHDEGLSRTYGRRVWGLHAGTGIGVAQARFGFIGLDRYKDWIVAPDEIDAAGRGARAEAGFPGAFFSPAHVERLRATLDRHPDGEYLKTWYLFSGKKEDAERHARHVIEGLKKPYGENNFYLIGLSGYRKSQFFVFANFAEDALACPELPADLRKELRLRLALYAHAMSDPDLNPRGSGVHLGNNNMTINRTLALTYFASLLPEHPLYDYWMKRVRAYARFKLASQTSPCGSWVACPSYQLYSPTRTLNISQNVLRNRGFGDLGHSRSPASSAPGRPVSRPEGRDGSPRRSRTVLIEDGWHAATLRYLANLTMSDPRWGGKRIIPGMGNSCNQLENVWGFCMAAVADRDPETAGWFRFTNRLTYGELPMEKGPNYHDKHTPHAFYFLPYIPERAEPLVTSFFPAYGVMFRAHFGSPDETAMLLRAGMNWSHWDTDALNLILYGKGAPLSPGTGYQYLTSAAQRENGIYHNQVKVGRRDLQEVFGRVDGAVVDYGFGESADYAVADRYYPPELFRDGRGEMRWRRHVMFLKSPRPEGPSYFVMRDTFPGGERRSKWWNWLNLEMPDAVTVDGKAFARDAVPVEKVIPEAEMPSARGRVVEMATAFGASSWFWWSEPREVRIRMVMQYNHQDGLGGKETKTIVEVPAGAGQDFHYVVFPRKGDEPPPVCEALGADVLKVRTRDATDYVFAGDEPFEFSRDDVTFTGRAGAVRVFADRVALCMNSGSGRVGYRGHVFEGHGPFERVVKLADLTGGLRRIKGGYEKKLVSVRLAEGVRVTGEAPFEARLDGESIVIDTKGRARVIHVTQPAFIVRPQLFVDGREWMASWTDYPASGWGSYRNTWLIGLSVPEGEHELVVRDLVFPTIWERPFTPLIDKAVTRGR